MNFLNVSFFVFFIYTNPGTHHSPVQVDPKLWQFHFKMTWCGFHGIAPVCFSKVGV